MNQIPEWMKSVADIGRMEKVRKEQQYPEQVTSLPVQGLWKESKVSRDEYIANIRVASNKASEESIKVQSMTKLANMLRGMPFEITNVSFENNCMTMNVSIGSNTYGTLKLPCQFNFNVTPQCEVVAPQVFSVQEQQYPVTPAGIQTAFNHQSRRVFSGNQIMTRSQIIDNLRSRDSQYVSQMFDSMLTANEITDLGDNRYAINRLPKAFAQDGMTPTQTSQQISVQQAQKAAKETEDRAKEAKEKLQRELNKKNDQQNVGPQPQARPAAESADNMSKSQQNPHGLIGTDPSSSATKSSYSSDKQRSVYSSDNKYTEIQQKLRKQLSASLKNLGFDSYEAPEQ